MVFSRLQDGLQADDPFSSHLPDHGVRVADEPVATHQLHCSDPSLRMVIR